MRDYFKGKIIESGKEGEWAEGYYAVYGKVQHVIIKDGEYGDNLAYEVDKDTVCRCADLIDINGKNIFENDIVSVPMRSYLGKEKNEIGIIEWLSGAFSVRWKNEEYGRHFAGYLDNIEIIGNIFDNPELYE